jgi:hypothetical protein
MHDESWDIPERYPAAFAVVAFSLDRDEPGRRIDD